MSLLLLLVSLTLGLLMPATLSSAKRSTCIQKEYNNGIACVCNSTYCDTVEEVGEIAPNTFVTYTTSRAGLRLERVVHTTGGILPPIPDASFNINQDKELQVIYGFGGAMTDAAGSNIYSLSEDAQKHLLRSYYSRDGIEHSITRVTMAGSDFSDREYTYDDGELDPALTNFHLVDEDIKYKIPFIKRGIRLNPQLKVFASSWGAPKWMQSGGLRQNVDPQFYYSWAVYNRRFVQEYDRAGIPMWALTPGNEPTTAVFVSWQPLDQLQWLKNHLIPELNRTGYGDVKLFICDDHTPFVPIWQGLFEDPDIACHVEGITTHGYFDEIPTVVPVIHSGFNSIYPQKTIFSSEVSICQINPLFTSSTNWGRGELYADNIIENLENHGSGWVDWNMALDMQGGPNYIGNFCDAPIRVNSSADEFYKQPMFYTVGHFSKFIPPGSKRIDLSYMPIGILRAVAFKTPDPSSKIVVVILNKNEWDYSATVCKDNKDCSNVNVPKRSIVTVITTPS